MRDAARAAADAADARAARGVSLGPLDGVIVSIKDLFDVAGEVDPRRLQNPRRGGGAGHADAPVVQRLRAAGAVIVAKTNMTEFAFSGIGANPHFGTPGNPRDRSRVPGGSSSGAAVAVADGMCDIAIGTDTGGSVRIPAALCGLVGFKPSRQRIPTAGAFPLSYTLDSIGPIAQQRRRLRQSRRGHGRRGTFTPLEPVALAGLSFGVAEGLPLDRLDDTVAAAFVAAVARLDRAGVRVTPRSPAVVRRHGCGQRQGRHLAAGGLRHPSRPHRAPRRRYRPECARADRARLRSAAAGLCLDDAGTGAARRRHGCAASARSTR